MVPGFRGVMQAAGLPPTLGLAVIGLAAGSFGVVQALKALGNILVRSIP